MDIGAAEATRQSARAIPDELRALPKWVCTKIVPGETKNQKIPINAKTGQGASSTNPATWATYHEVNDMLTEWDGFDHTHVDAKTGAELTGPLVLPGFVLTDDDPYCIIDLDHCIDVSGTLAPWAQDVVDHFRSCTEKSLLGNGLHIIVRGRKPAGAWCKIGALECYDTGRYFALTGDTLIGLDVIEDRQSELDAFIEKHRKIEKPRPAPRAHTGVDIDAEIVLKRAYASKQAEKLKTLLSGDLAGLPSDSDADLSACSILAFFCGYVDDDQAARVIDGIIRDSKRYRDKWDTIHRPADGATYGAMTIEKALAGGDRYKTKAEFKAELTADAAELMKSLNLTTQDVVNMAHEGQKGCAQLFTNIYGAASVSTIQRVSDTFSRAIIGILPK